VETTCSGCQLLRVALELAGPKKSGQPSSFVSVFGRGGRLGISINHDCTSSIDVFTLPNEPSVPSIRVAPLLPGAQLQDNLGRIKRWLMRCEQDHLRCRSVAAFLPKRLLAIKSDDVVCLVEQATLAALPEAGQASTRYACVSHCWGRTRSKHITYHHNLASNLGGIPIAELPVTFRHAIEIVQALGIEYLWIDSLCIIQDDIEDWDIHVELMADIYRSAYITLAAGDSIDDDGGFFLEADPKFNATRTLRMTGKDVGPVDLKLRLLPLHPDNMSSDPSTSPLEERGWIFQERFLSRRFLCFKRNEIQWECLEDVACTCSSIDGCFNSQYNPTTSEPAFPDCQPVKWKLARLENLDKDAVCALWRKIVRMYSERLLSFEKDKLPALAGLAIFFAEVNGNTYMYGLWRESIQYDLMWQRGGNQAKFGRPERDVPSWSCAAAADGDFVLWATSTERCGTTFDVVGVEGNHLTLSGFVSLIQLEVINDPSYYIGPFESELVRWCTVSQLTEQEMHSSKTQGRFAKALRNPVAFLKAWGFPRWKPQASFAADYRFWNNAEELQASISKTYFLDLTRHAELERPPKGQPGRAQGMILRKSGTGTFERIGILAFYDTFSNFKPPREIFWYPTGERQTITIS
jgi:hypothetical protein